jgi:hypothetical protein
LCWLSESDTALITNPKESIIFFSQNILNDNSLWLIWLMMQHQDIYLLSRLLSNLTHCRFALTRVSYQSRQSACRFALTRVSSRWTAVWLCS